MKFGNTYALIYDTNDTKKKLNNRNENITTNTK